VNDGVMGRVSDGRFKVTGDKTLVFSVLTWLQRLL
jgi:hypothetical protein